MSFNYNISPFQSSDRELNNFLPNDNSIDQYLRKRFGESQISYHFSGRNAIAKALSYYHLQPDDVVTIFTTSQNFYISSCVTNEIEKFCKWEREITDQTKVLFVNHEFGYPYENLAALKELQIPIIEDCAHSFFSNNKNATIGTIGDFVIYSLPKMFPLQNGGLLISKMNSNKKVNDKSEMDHGSVQYIKNVLSYHIPFEKNIIKNRLENYSYLENKLNKYGFTPFFQMKSGIVPGVFLFELGNKEIDLSKFKEHMQQRGIESSVFYGKKAFFIPVHQNLTTDDLDYFIAVIESYIR